MNQSNASRKDAPRLRFGEDGGMCGAPRTGWHSRRRPPPRGLAVRSALTVGKQPMCGGFCLGSGLITVESGANCFPSSFCRPHPHNTRALSHRAKWLQSLWLQSLCRHSSSKLSLLLISLPPLHFSKLRCSFVSLQWFYSSALPVAFLPFSCSCSDSG